MHPPANAFTETVTFWLRKQGFVLLLFSAVLLAFILPEPAAVGGVDYVKWTADAAVVLIFLLQGLSLPTRQMLSGSQPVRLHAFVLGWNFILFPVLAALLIAPVSSWLGPEIGMGLWMLAILPTTIASATALTSASGGAVPQAIFASIFSNLLAILFVPLLAIGYLSSASGAEISLAPVFTKLFWIVFVPLFSGQCLRRLFRRTSVAVSQRTRWLPQAAILYIVYLSFAQTVSSGVLEAIPIGRLVGALLAVTLLLLLVSWGVWRSSKWLSLDRAQRTSAFFTASQKSIATGLPLLTTVFGAASLPVETGIILVPLLLYHSLQLLLGGILVSRFTASSFLR